MSAQRTMNLTVAEHADLRECEAVIERGIRTFVEVGVALLRIRDDRLYRDEYGTFEDYCRERWGMTRRYANHTIAAAGVISNLGTIVPKPETESQARPLAALPPEQQREAWIVAVNSVDESEKVTAKVVEEAVREVAAIPTAMERAPVPDPPERAPSEPERAFNYKRDAKRAVPADIYTPKGYDACQTPPEAIDPLLPYLPDDWLIWEPACGEGLLAEGFYDAGREIIGTDILWGKNFFEWAPGEHWDALVTNPPYSVKYQWIERCYALGKPFALLLPLETLGASTAQNLFREYGMELICLDRRVNFKMPNVGWDGGGAQFPVAWFTWGLGIGQQITYGRLARKS